MLTSEVVDDWGLPIEFHLFAQHEEHSVRYGSHGSSLRMLFVESMTPVDMINLSNGTHDATGHCVWTGAYIFLKALSIIQEEYKCFQGRRVLELGCGPGMAGIAVATHYGDSFVAFTDADPEALDLCRRNCVHNNLSSDRYAIQNLLWGSQETELSHHDTIIATDVIYDITILPLFFASAERCCKSGGFFVLVHVPRACYTSDCPKSYNESLESHIVSQASGFDLCRVWRVSELDKTPVLIDDEEIADPSLEGETEAAVLVFKKLMRT